MTARAGAAHEVELKLRIPAPAAASVLRHPAVAAVKRGRTRTVTLTSVYFDTPDHALADAGVGVRLRSDGRGWLQAVKGPATGRSGGGMNERMECEWRIARQARRPPLDVAKLADTPCRRAIEKATRRAPLAPVFTTRIERTIVPLRFADETTAQLCLDRGFVHAGVRPGRGVPRQSVVEIELELESGDRTRLFDLALALARDVPLDVEPRSKAQRGFDLIAPRATRARHAEPVELRNGASAAEALAAAIRSGLAQLEGNAGGVTSGHEPESVHQMRVGVRRLRSALGLLARVLQDDGGDVQSLRAELRWIAGLLGRVRDLDVFATQTLAAIASGAQQIGAADDLAQNDIVLLASRAHAQATDARKDVRAAIASPRFTRLLLGVARLASDARLGAPPGTPGNAVLQAPARRFASRLLDLRHRKLRRSFDALGASAEERHRVRIRAKTMRYAAEFVATLFPGKRARAYRKALKEVQQVLGAANDAATAIALASQLAPDSPASALVRGWAAAQLSAQDERLARAWRRFATAKRFWAGAAD